MEIKYMRTLTVKVNIVNHKSTQSLIKPLHDSKKGLARIGMLLDRDKWSVIELPDQDKVPRSAEIFHNTYVEELAKEIARTETFVYIMSGELSSKIWGDPRIMEALLVCKAQTIKILCGPEIDIKSLDVLKLVAMRRIRLYFTDERRTTHFVVTDKAVILEEEHARFTSTKAVYFGRGSKRIVRFFRGDFAWIILPKSSVDPSTILEKFKPKIFYANAKECNVDPTEEEKKRFLAEIGVKPK